MLVLCFIWKTYCFITFPCIKQKVVVKSLSTFKFSCLCLDRIQVCSQRIASRPKVALFLRPIHTFALHVGRSKTQHVLVYMCCASKARNSLQPVTLFRQVGVSLVVRFALTTECVFIALLVVFYWSYLTSRCVLLCMKRTRSVCNIKQ